MAIQTKMHFAQVVFSEIIIGYPVAFRALQVKCLFALNLQKHHGNEFWTRHNFHPLPKRFIHMGNWP